MNLLEITILVEGDVNNLIGWLQGRGLFANPLYCSTCDRDMVLALQNENHIAVSGNHNFASPHFHLDVDCQFETTRSDWK